MVLLARTDWISSIQPYTQVRINMVRMCIREIAWHVNCRCLSFDWKRMKWNCVFALFGDMFYLVELWWRWRYANGNDDDNDSRVCIRFSRLSNDFHLQEISNFRRFIAMVRFCLLSMRLNFFCANLNINCWKSIFMYNSFFTTSFFIHATILSIVCLRYCQLDWFKCLILVAFVQ